LVLVRKKMKTFCLLSQKMISFGNLRNKPVWITNLADTLLVSIPFLLASYTAVRVHFLNGFVSGLYLVQLAAVVRTSDMHARFYAIRFFFPVLSGLALYVFSLEYSADWSPQLLYLFSLMGTANLAFVISLALGDAGIHLNRYVRTRLNSMAEEPWITGALQLMLVAVSGYMIVFAALVESKNYFHLFLTFLIVLVSIIHTEKQRGTILSAALAVYSLASVSECLFSVSTVTVIATAYNNFILNSDQPEVRRLMHMDIPLLDEEDSEGKVFALSKRDAENSRFRFVCNNLLLSAVFSLDSFFEPTLFLHVSLVVSLWLLLAPIILRDRDFPL